MTPQKQFLTSLLQKFPNAATKTLATIAYKEAPSLFTDPEGARSSIRRMRGAAGQAHRKCISDKSHFREPRKSGDPFAKLPKGLTHFESWGAEQLDGPLRVLVLADLHIPYHDKQAVVAALDR